MAKQIEQLEQRLDQMRQLHKDTIEVLQRLVAGYNWQQAQIDELRRLRARDELAQLRIEHLHQQCISDDEARH